jgi:hypothetical protein
MMIRWSRTPVKVTVNNNGETDLLADGRGE